MSTSYDIQVQEEINALEAYKRLYETQNPKPVFEAEEIESKTQKVILGVIAFMSIIVSAGHTIPVVMETYIDLPIGLLMLISLAALIMIEGVLVSGTHILIEMLFRTERNPNAIVISTLTAVTFLALIVAIAANLFSSLKGYGYPVEQYGIGIAFLVGFTAPITAALSGILYSIIGAKDKVDNKTAQLEYDQRLRLWKNDLDKSWNQNKGKFGISKNVQAKLGKLDYEDDFGLNGKSDYYQSENKNGHLLAVRSLSPISDYEVPILSENRLSDFGQIQSDSPKILSENRLGFNIPEQKYICPNCGKQLKKSGY